MKLRLGVILSLVYLASLASGALAVGRSSNDRSGLDQLFQAGPTARVSVDSFGQQANAGSTSPAISADGRYVAFESDSSNLVPNDTNGYRDVFVHDLFTGQTERVSVSSTGGESNGWSMRPAISGDGRYIAFVSYADNLVPGDTNMHRDVFVHDRHTGMTERVSVNSNGEQGDSYSVVPDISADGRYVVFVSGAQNLVPGDANNNDDVFVRDRLTGETRRASVSSAGDEANSASYDPRLSGDGRYIAFASSANNLVADDTNGYHDVFVHDQEMGQTERISLAHDGSQANGPSQVPRLSYDGRFISFYSRASNLVPGDTNQLFDVFVRDRQLAVNTRVSVSSEGVQGNGDSFFHAISAAGDAVAYMSYASNLVPNDTNGALDVFLHDLTTGETRRATVSVLGQQPNGSLLLRYPSISGDGRLIVFDSDASNLIPDDSNEVPDIFVHDRTLAAQMSHVTYFPTILR